MLNILEIIYTDKASLKATISQQTLVQCYRVPGSYFCECKAALLNGLECKRLMDGIYLINLEKSPEVSALLITSVLEEYSMSTLDKFVFLSFIFIFIILLGVYFLKL